MFGTYDSKISHNFQGISSLRSQLFGSLLLFFIKLSNCCTVAQQGLCPLLRGAICQLFCFKDCLLCLCSYTDPESTSTKNKTKRKKCNFYSLRISLQMEKFSNCVFQNVLNWELKENSFCSYTGDREKETLKNRMFWERKKNSCLLALVKWQYSTGGKNERGTENFQLNIW